jgi:hypothetical protein
MEDAGIANGARRSLPFILLVAVLQGWALYGLHNAIVQEQWPATDTAWLFACYAIALFVPVTLQLLARFSHLAAAWLIIALLAAVYFYFGWHHGSAVVVDREVAALSYDGGLFALGLAAVVLWLMVLPFVQARLIAGRWNAHYPTLFTAAWHNHLILAEALLFTGLFWLLLQLWAALFDMLDIGFFRELFAEPIFFYPVTALVFGIALHLIGSIDRLTSVALEQVLNLLKWLALLAGAILVLFTLTLAAKLPGLLVSGQLTISAAWLLWLVAVIVLLLNAAYRDGLVSQPFPRGINQFLRWVVPLTTIVALTAVYALMVRITSYGLTVERFWACVVAGAAAVYALGYSATVFDRGGWLPGISRVNVIAALILIITIAVALTPVLSPYRLAANSQFQRAQQPPGPSTDVEDEGYIDAGQLTPFQYLRFEAGRYGIDRLHALAALQEGPDAARISKSAGSALEQEHRWSGVSPVDPDAYVAALQVYPTGRHVDAALGSAIALAIQDTGAVPVQLGRAGTVGLFVDLGDDGREEFIVLSRLFGRTFAQDDSGWSQAAVFYRSWDDATWAAMLDNLERGKFEAVAPRWKELRIGSSTINVSQRF